MNLDTESVQTRELHDTETHLDNGTEGAVQAKRRALRERWPGYEDTGNLLLHTAIVLELKDVKTAMIIAPDHPYPVSVEGLLIEHHSLPLCSHMEITLSADDREIVHEQFYLPTSRRGEVMAAHRELVVINAECLTNPHLRDRAMAIYFPELAEDYDFWYRVTIDDDGVMSFGLHMGPSHHQDVKKRIEGTLQL